MRSILLIEDDPTFQKLYRINLEKRAYTVHCLDDGSEVLPFLHQSPVDLTIISAMLKNGDCAELLSQMAADSTIGAIPVLVISDRYSSSHRDFEQFANIHKVLSSRSSVAELVKEVEAIR